MEHKIQTPSLCGRLPRPCVSFCVCNFVIISLKKCLPNSMRFRLHKPSLCCGPTRPLFTLSPEGGTGLPVVLSFLIIRGSEQRHQSEGLWNGRPTLGRFVCSWGQGVALEDFLGSLLVKRLLDNCVEPRSSRVSSVSRS